MITRKTNILSSLAATLVAAIALVMSSCSADDEMLTGNSTEFDNVVRIGAVIDDVATRAGYDNSNLTEFGLYIINKSDPSQKHENVKVSKDDKGNWKTGKEIKWFGRDQAVDIIAYAPYDENQMLSIAIDKDNNFTYNIGYFLIIPEQSDNNYFGDFIGCKAKDFVPSKNLINGKLNVTFKHLLTKLKVVIKLDPTLGTFTSNPISNVSVGGTSLTGYLDLNGSEAKATEVGNIVTDITPTIDSPFDTDSSSATYTCVTYPQTVSAGNLTVSFTFQGNDIKWTSTQDYNLVGGAQNTINITVK